jgi:multiple sugar transport system substrate-binding protein
MIEMPHNRNNRKDSNMKSQTKLDRRRLEAALLAAAIGAVPLAGASASASDLSHSATKVTLTFWTHTDPPMVSVDSKLIAEYERQNPNVKINTTTIPNVSFFTKMLVSMTTGSGPDVFDMLNSDIPGTYVQDRVLAPVDPQAIGYKSDAALVAAYDPGTFSGVTVNGTIYGMPLEDDAAAFAINTKLFQQAGLNPNDYPTTWQQVGKDGAIVAKKLNVQGYNLVYLGGGTWMPLQLEPLLAQTGCTVVNQSETAGVLTSAPCVNALSQDYDIINIDKAGNPHTATINSSVPYYDFDTGKQAMTITWAWAIAQLKDQFPQTLKDVKVVPLPQVNPKDPVNYAYGYSWVVSAKAPSYIQQASWKFVAFLDDHYSDYIATSGQIQPKVGWQNTTAARQIPFASEWTKVYASGPQDFPGLPDPDQVENILQTAGQAALEDGVKPAAALSQANSALNSVLHG